MATHGPSSTSHASISEMDAMEEDDLDTYTYVQKIQDLKRCIETLKELEIYIRSGNIVKASQGYIQRIKNQGLRDKLKEFTHLYSLILTKIATMQNEIFTLEQDKEKIKKDFLELLKTSTNRNNNEEDGSMQGGATAVAFEEAKNAQPQKWEHDLIQWFQDVAKLVGFPGQIDTYSVNNAETLEAFLVHLKTKVQGTGEQFNRPVMLVRPTIKQSVASALQVHSSVSQDNSRNNNLQELGSGVSDGLSGDGDAVEQQPVEVSDDDNL